MLNIIVGVEYLAQLLQFANSFMDFGSVNVVALMNLNMTSMVRFR